MKDSPRAAAFTIRRIAIVEGDSRAAEMLHTFFRVMELDSTVISLAAASVDTIRRAQADAILLDLDAADLRAVELARELRHALPGPRILFLTADAARFGPSVLQKPRSFDDLLDLLAALAS